MEVIRAHKIGTSYFKVGDQIELENGYSATCQKAGKKKALFFLDQYLDKTYPMNVESTNEGGYEASDLRKELQKDEVLDIFEPVRESMIPFKNGDLLRIPYREELFGEADIYEPSEKKQLPLMSDRRNRIASRKDDEYEQGWLMNKVKDSVFYFALVCDNGNANYDLSSRSYGVRPVFRLRQVV